MIIEDNTLCQMQVELHHLDEYAAQTGFVRWQWEYTRATYDAKIIDQKTGADYFLRIDTRTVSGKLENPAAVLHIHHIYLGRGTFPHGLDYDSPIPESVLKVAKERLAALKKRLLA